MNITIVEYVKFKTKNVKQKWGLLKSCCANNNNTKNKKTKNKNIKQSQINLFTAINLQLKQIPRVKKQRTFFKIICAGRIKQQRNNKKKLPTQKTKKKLKT